LSSPGVAATGCARRSTREGERYDAALRLRLDVTQLPKPFQVNALALREWQLATTGIAGAFTAMSAGGTDRWGEQLLSIARGALGCLLVVCLVVRDSRSFYLRPPTTANTALFARQLRRLVILNAGSRRACECSSVGWQVLAPADET
jgi:hypothetical protein